MFYFCAAFLLRGGPKFIRRVQSAEYTGVAVQALCNHNPDFTSPSTLPLSPPFCPRGSRRALTSFVCSVRCGHRRPFLLRSAVLRHFVHSLRLLEPGKLRCVVPFTSLHHPRSHTHNERHGHNHAMDTMNAMGPPTRLLSYSKKSLHNKLTGCGRLADLLPTSCTLPLFLLLLLLLLRRFGCCGLVEVGSVHDIAC